ncbi:GDSL esterase/lipase [Morus notabilis]|uniref:GDSL esterase/lipase n=2 Tax=Morus notabilis TaxID=981085 RepID=W9RDK4_9ROSA|nr:GDSL esterase/lipase [Morus notabilis]
MYVFGDSLVDAGNNNYLVFSLVKANFPHNGIDFPTKKPTGRFCNGKNAVDLLSEIVGLPPSPPYLSVAFKLKKSRNQFLTGANFASGGSGIMNQTNKMFSLSLTKQVGYFLAVHKALNKQLGPTGANKHFSKSLFLIVTGSNDIFSYFGSDELRNKSTPSQYVNLMSFTLKGQLKRLYNLGARKFVFVGTGLIGCIPSERNKNKGEQCNEEVNHWSVKYNEALRLMLRNLKFELNGINYSYFDGYSVMQNFIQKPTAYGFSEVKAACCGMGKLKAEIPCLPISSYCNNRSNHLFWDGSHPTEAAHRIFVDHIFYGPLQYTFPVNVKKLIAI